MKKYGLPLFFVFLLFACQSKQQQAVDEELMVQQALEKIDWTKVDAYPSVDRCDSLLSETERQQCFFEFISSNLQERLHLDTLVGVYPKIDTLQVLVTIFPDAKISFEPYQVSDSLAFESNEIDSILQLRLEDFPQINPALKRGIPVKTQFVLPIILKVD